MVFASTLARINDFDGTCSLACMSYTTMLSVSATTAVVRKTSFGDVELQQICNVGAVYDGNAILPVLLCVTSYPAVKPSSRNFCCIPWDIMVCVTMLVVMAREELLFV